MQTYKELNNMVLANQNAKLTGPDQGFLVSPLDPRPHSKAWERGCAGPGEVPVGKSVSRAVASMYSWGGGGGGCRPKISE